MEEERVEGGRIDEGNERGRDGTRHGRREGKRGGRKRAEEIIDSVLRCVLKCYYRPTASLQLNNKGNTKYNITVT